MGRKGPPPYKSSTNAGGNEEIMAASIRAESVESPRPDAVTLNVVRMTPPVEATLRILLNSVPYLIGAAVVRQPAVVGSDSLGTIATTTPSVEEPRRLVVVPDEPMPEPESSLVIEPPAESEPVLDPKDAQDERDSQIVDEVARALDELTDARSIGRVLRDAVTAIAGVDGFSVALFNSVRREVAYRYKVVGADPDSAEMGRQAIDDGPDCYAARHDRRWHGFVREIGVRRPEGVE